jgi:dTDP-4-amino-4,6-dideoxygalactose transaminase
VTLQEQVPFHKAAVGEEEIAAVADVMRSGWLTMGAITFQFEQEFARYVAAPHALAVSSCTAALHLALEAIGLQPGDEVLLPTTTFTATAEVVAYFGARPVLVDIEPDTMNMDAGDARRRITPRTKAIIPVHLAGQPCDMEEIIDLAESCGLRVVEDAAHALPASYRSRPVGSICEFTAFSFYATKTLCTGEGGMITTTNEECAERMKMMRLHGISRDAWNRYSSEGSWRYEVLEAGYKYNLTDIQAAIGLVQLAKCDALCAARERIAAHYNSEFAGNPALQIPKIRSDRRSSWHLYILRVRPEVLGCGRDDFLAALRVHGIGTSVHFIPLHLQPYYQRKFGYRRGDFPVAEAQYERCLSLPLFPSMTKDQVECVIEAVNGICRSAPGRAVGVADV